MKSIDPKKTSESQSISSYHKLITANKFESLQQKFTETKNHFDLVKRKRKRKFALEFSKKSRNITQDALKKIRQLVKKKLILIRRLLAQIISSLLHLMEK